MNAYWSWHFILKLGSKVPFKYVVTNIQFLFFKEFTFYLSECGAYMITCT